MPRHAVEKERKRMCDCCLKEYEDVTLFTIGPSNRAKQVRLSIACFFRIVETHSRVVGDPKMDRMEVT